MLTTVALLFSGSVQALIAPPFHWTWLHPISWVPAFWVFARLGERRALKAGWLVGTSANLAIFYWLAATVTLYGGVPMPLGISVLVLFAAATGFYTAVFAFGFARVRAASGRRWPFALAAWFCAVEFSNPQLFGYLQGVAWYRMPQIFLVSALTGPSGLSFLVIACNAVVLQGLELAGASSEPARRVWRTNVAILALLLLAAAVYSKFRLREIEQAETRAEPITIALVQPNHTIERRHELHAAGWDAFARDLVEQSREALANDRNGREIDVFVWPEGALRADPAQSYHRAVLEFVADTGAEVWTGGNHHEIGPEGTTVSHNSAYRVFGPGEIDRRYDKNILVPFGEYVPLAGVVPGFDRIPTVASFERGNDVPVYQSGPARFVFSICYEAIRSGFVRRSIRDDVNLIVNVTVDAWYGDTSEQSQHLMLAAMQAAMNGLPLVRATTTGISAFVDARGTITAETAKFTRETLVRDVRPVRVAAPYTRWGEWFAWGCVLVSLFLLGKSVRSTSGPPPPRGRPRAKP